MGSANWKPTTVTRFLNGIPSSARTAIVETDAGTGYLKALGNPEGPNTLACELVGTRLAQWLGLPTLDFALIEVDEIDDIPFYNAAGEPEGHALPGMAFVTRKERGETWGGKQRQLKELMNPKDISRLVVFDTWTLNCDRYGLNKNPLKRPRINRGNVFLSEEALKGTLCLKAIDHTHCFTCGRPLTSRVADLDTIQDERVFGLFPEFRKYLNRDAVQDSAARLRELERSFAASTMQDIPSSWEVKKGVQEAWVDLIVRRAGFVSERIEAKLWPQKPLDYGADK
jgi:hypothetical protein